MKFSIPGVNAGKAQGGSFLPEDYVARKNAQRAGFLTLSLFSIVMFGVVGAFLVTNRRWNDIRAEQKVINTQYEAEAKKIEQLKTLETQRAQMMEKAEVVAALLEKVPRSVLLAEVVTNLPKGVSLTSLELKSKRIEDKSAPVEAGKVQKVGTLSGGGTTGGAAKGKPAGSKTSAMKPKDAKTAEPARVLPPRFEFTLLLEGVSTQNTDIADYLTALKASELLESVDLQSIQETMVENAMLRQFKMEARLSQKVNIKDIEGLSGGEPGVAAVGESASAAPAGGDAAGSNAAPSTQTPPAAPASGPAQTAAAGTDGK